MDSHNNPQLYDSTNLISRKLSATELKPLPSSSTTTAEVMDSDYEIVDADEINAYDVVETDIQFHSNAYTPSELDKIIYHQFNKKFVYQQSVYRSGTSSVIADIFQNKDKRIVLFKTVKDTSIIQLASHQLSLEDTLSSYKIQKGFDASHLLIMPVSEYTRRHFRLLTITGNEIKYYDSKNSLINLTTRSLAPLVPTAMSAFDEAEKSAQSKTKEYEVNHDDAQIEPVLSTMAAIVIASSAAGSFAYHATTSYQNYHDCIRWSCAKYFPEHDFQERPLGHQAYNDHVNCGPYTAAYAVQVAEGLSPKNVNADPIVLRVLQAVDNSQNKTELASPSPMP